MHSPDRQTCASLQVWPHEPQFEWLVEVSTQLPSHKVVPAGHDTSAGSPASSTSRPSPPSSSKPSLHSPFDSEAQAGSRKKTTAPITAR
jgi:hypothetical protein